MTAGSMARERNGSIEHLRILAALGIVCFHAEKGGTASAIGYAGLPAFVLISAFYATRSLRRPGAFAAESFAEFALRKARRLLLPWIAWIGFYVLCDLGLVLLGMRDLSDLIARFNPFFGTRIHLWYLPFIFIGTLLLRQVVPLLKGFKGVPIAALATVMGVLLTAVLPAFTGRATIPEPGPQFLFATPAFIYGFALAQIVDRGRETSPWIAVGVILIGGEVGAIARQYLYQLSWLSYGLALSLVAFAILVPKREDAWCRALAPLTLGIYLIHPFVLGVIRRIDLMNRVGLPESLTFILGFAGSVAFVAWLKRGRLAFVV